MIRSRLGRLFFNAERLARLVEFDDAVALWIRYLIGKDDAALWIAALA